MKFGIEVNKILKRLKNGESCYEKLYNLTYKHLYFIARLYLVDKSMVDDVLSETYISVYKNIKSFDDEKNGYNWLCKIVQNKSYNINASTRSYESLNDNREIAFDVFEDVITRCDIGNILKSLKKEEQELIFLRFFEDKTYLEIASMKNVSAQMIHKSIKKIIKKIEKLL